MWFEDDQDGSQRPCNARVNERYMNELKLYSNKSDHDDMMVKKCLKKR